MVPATFITTLAGLALLDTIGASIASAMADSQSREASLITFLACVANITVSGIGGAFWGLLIGLGAYAVLNGRWSMRESCLGSAVKPVLTTKDIDTLDGHVPCESSSVSGEFVRASGRADEADHP